MIFLACPVAIGFQPPVEHPLRLLLLRRNEADRLLAQSFRSELGVDVGDEAVLIGLSGAEGLDRLRRCGHVVEPCRCEGRGVADKPELAAAAGSTMSASETSQSACRTAALSRCRPTREGQMASTSQRGRPDCAHRVSRTGPSNRLTIAPTGMAAAGQAKREPPPPPRAAGGKPARHRRAIPPAPVGARKAGAAARSAGSLLLV